MIKILKEMDKITIKGHAGYRESNDIVCASISTIMSTTVYAILNFNDKAINFTDNNNECIITINTHDDITDKLIDNMILMFEEVSKEYPSNVEIK